MNKLLELIKKGNNNEVFCEKINYYGWENNYLETPHIIHGAVNNYLFCDMPEIKENMLEDGRSSVPSPDEQQYMDELMFITVHDTGGGQPTSTAWANSHWCTNPNNTGTSWHYTTGNDGIFKQVSDNKICYHAGDGTSWGTTTILYDTKIKADPNLRNRAKVTHKDGYFYVNGIKTSIKTPEGTQNSTKLNDLGFACVVKNGNYHLPLSYLNRNGVICAHGGNLNSIGIETCVNTTSDVYLTWCYTAKLVATLLVKHNLTPDRVLFHNNWSNKKCPQTMMTCNKVDMFLDMVYLEYYILKDYSDYSISFISNNPDIIDNNGRVIGNGPLNDTKVSYTVTVKYGEKEESITLNSLVKGSKYL